MKLLRQLFRGDDILTQRRGGTERKTAPSRESVPASADEQHEALDEALGGGFGRDVLRSGTAERSETAVGRESPANRSSLN